MPYGYFDTSALMRWVEVDVVQASALNARTAPEVDGLLAAKDQELAVSELTLLEFRAAVAQDWRRTDAQCQDFDTVWASAARLKLMTALANGRIRIVPNPPKAAEHAIGLVDMAAREHQLPLGTWDAIHLITAAAWGHSCGAVVQLYTSDDDFDDFIRHYAHFSTFVEVVNLEVITRP